ncbi:hypothetical protein RUM44_004283 [Polyplax serrata]|uniref:Uncharacterized protein n=1 Tax=Polyplax serrata TaxID=468196 RepID=A0ABR1B325_POLSC
MKYFLVLLSVFAVCVCAAEKKKEEEKKVFQRLIPADVLRDKIVVYEIIMKVLAVFVVAFVAFCHGEESETTEHPKVFRRLIPADVLRVDQFGLSLSTCGTNRFDLLKPAESKAKILVRKKLKAKDVKTLTGH